MGNTNMNTNSASKDFFSKKVAILFYAFVVIVVRDAQNYTDPVFFAEDATEWFRFAYYHDLMASFISPHFSYYSIVNNVVGILGAKFLGLRYAPFAPVLAVFLVQMFTVSVIVFSNSIFGNSFYKKLLSVLYILFIIEAAFTVATTVIYFYFGLITFLILLMDLQFENRFFKLLLTFNNFLGAFSAGISCFFIPFYIHKYLKTKEKFYLTNLGLLILGGGVQFLALIYSKMHHTGIERIGLSQFNLKAFFMEPLIANSINQYFAFLNVPLPIILLILSIAILYFNRHDYLSTYLFCAIFAVWVPLFLLSHDSNGGLRYAFIPNVIFFLFLLHNAFKVSPTSRYSKFFLFLLIILSGMSYRLNSIAISVENKVVWRNEVDDYLASKKDYLEIYPNGWRLELTDRKSR